MGLFESWFNKKLYVKKYPEDNHLKVFSREIKVVINVSEEYKIAQHTIAEMAGLKYYWFPIYEHSNNNDMGLTSIFGAMFILYICEINNWPVMVHCHAGANRSPLIAQSYYFLRTGRHIVEPHSEKHEEDMMKMFSILPEEADEYKRIMKQNRIISNIEFGNLPCRSKYEKFLKECAKAFHENHQNFGNKEISLDTIMHNAGLAT